ncbi:zinc dependent phospholipase C family protein [Paenibacillus thalictri]|uniref:Phospholipase C/D domain-containing protein n=1 Tax=Paenibacillus thalictri TaxID=2527873 RepID=A0A4Q9DK67_9BACL|nr:zinc dependent phospholipase C family protein [Paenibacillus thalictri]TBL75116.1 hypothetical protein EYB31_24205 [Paenibacillus thalictri]
MPLPMIHLAVAFELYSGEAAPPAPEFLLGSIAPDAIHMRSGTGRNDKKFTHLIGEDGRFSESAVEHFYMNRLYAEERGPVRQFLRGYCAHLLADALWLPNIFIPFSAKADAHPSENRSEKEIRALYYKDTDQIDFDMYRQSSWRPAAWKLLEQAESPEWAPYLSADEIARWRRRVIDWFEQPENEPGTTPQFITGAMAAGFIKEAAAYVADKFSEWDLRLPESRRMHV